MSRYQKISDSLGKINKIYSFKDIIHYELGSWNVVSEYNASNSD